MKTRYKILLVILVCIVGSWFGAIMIIDYVYAHPEISKLFCPYVTNPEEPTSECLYFGVYHTDPIIQLGFITDFECICR